MIKIINCIFLVMIFCSPNVYGQDLVLNKDSLGPLKLSKETLISKEILNGLFPDFIVIRHISDGDGASFHHFRIFDKKRELLFSIRSYINNQVDFDKLNKVDRELKALLIKYI